MPQITHRLTSLIRNVRAPRRYRSPITSNAIARTLLTVTLGLAGCGRQTSLMAYHQNRIDLSGYSCGNVLSTGPSSCSNLSLSPTSNKIEEILSYKSMQHVRQLIDSNCEIRPRLAQMLENYDPFLPIKEIDARFDQVFKGVPLEDYCFTSNNFSTRITKDFLKNLVHTLYVELNEIVPWSIKQYTPEQMESLLPTSSILPDSLYPKLFYQKDPGINNENRDPYKIFALVKEHIRSDQATTATEVIQLIPVYFFHSYINKDRQENWTWESYRADDYSYPFTSAYADMPQERQWNYLPLEALFRERVLATGCHRASMIAATFLRALNIPAQEINLFNRTDPNYLKGNTSHGTLWLPSLGLFSHGDWLSTSAGTPGELLLYNERDFLKVTHIEGSNGLTQPSGVPDARFGVSLRRNKDGLLYLEGGFSTKRMSPGAFPIQGFDGSIDRPFHQVVRMLEILRKEHPSARFVPDPKYPTYIKLISDPIPVQTLEQMRSKAAGQ